MSTKLRVRKPTLAALAVCSAALGVVANRLGALAEAAMQAGEGFPGCFTQAASQLGASLAADPLSLSFPEVGSLSGVLGLLASWQFNLMVIGVAAPWALWAFYVSRKGNYRPGEEEGSAEFMTEREMRAFGDRTDPYNNVILSRTARLALSAPRFDLERDRNKNCLLVGGPGSGKTRYFVKPNLMQLAGSYVITDPKGTLVQECGQMFVAADYDVQVLNTINFAESMKINPFAFIRAEEDIQPLITCIVKNVKPKDAGKASDPFWEQSEKLLLCAIVALMFEMYHERHPERITFRTMNRLLALLSVAEGDSDSKCALDLIFEAWRDGRPPTSAAGRTRAGGGAKVSPEAAARAAQWVGLVREPHPDSWACQLYLDQFRKGAGKTLKSVMSTVNSDLWVFGMPAVLDLTDTNELRLDGIGGLVSEDLARAAQDDPAIAEPGDGTPCGACEAAPRGQRKSALFLIMNDSDETYNFLVAVTIYLLFNRLKNYADRSCPHGGLPVPVQCIFDEFANIGKVEAFDQLMTTVRSRNIGITVIVQNLSQLEKGYEKDAARTIKGACDTWVYLGGVQDNETNEEISKKIGDETVNNRNASRSFGEKPSSSQSEQIVKRPLMTPDELERLPRRKCVVLISGAGPYRDDKYVIEEHPRWRFIDPGHKGKPRFALLWDGRPLKDFGRGWDACVFDRPFSVAAWRRELDERARLAASERIRGRYAPTGEPVPVPEQGRAAIERELARWLGVEPGEVSKMLT